MILHAMTRLSVGLSHNGQTENSSAVRKSTSENARRKVLSILLVGCALLYTFGCLRTGTSPTLLEENDFLLSLPTETTQELPKAMDCKDLSSTDLLPVTELRMVRIPGEYHLVEDATGSLYLTDWWYEEFITGSGSARQWVEPSEEPGETQASAIPQVLVEVAADGFWGKSHGRFVIKAGEQKQVVLRNRWEQKTIEANFDGYLLDLGFEQSGQASTLLNGKWQPVGKGHEFDKVLLRMHWE